MNPDFPPVIDRIPTLVLIDAAGIWRAEWEARKDASAFAATLQRAHELASRYDHCGICVDSPPYRRNKLSPSYKGNRQRLDRSALDQYARVKAKLADDGFAIFAADGYEADDVIASLVEQAEHHDDLAIIIASSDKDLMQLVDDARMVSVFRISTGEVYDEAAVRQEFLVPPSGIRDVLALAGDTADNVAGVANVGKKTASIIVNGEGLEWALEGRKISGLAQKVANAICEARESVTLARKLVTLETDAPVDIADALKPRVARRRSESPTQHIEPRPIVDAPRILTPEPVEIVRATSTGQIVLAEEWDAGISVERIVKRVEKVREIQREVMKKDHHYGVIPGTKKPSLYKPGAEILGLTFQLGPKFKAEERRDGDHLECIMTCTLVYIPTGLEVGDGVGSCSTRESKYAWRGDGRKCPKCGACAIRESKFNDGGWYCNQKAGGCNAKFALKDPLITSQQPGRVPNPDLYDQHNTVRKMACKRAHIAAILFSTGASEIFTQDAEDLPGAESGGDAEWSWHGAGEYDRPQPNRNRRAG